VGAASTVGGSNSGVFVRSGRGGIYPGKNRSESTGDGTLQRLDVYLSDLTVEVDDRDDKLDSVGDLRETSDRSGDGRNEPINKFFNRC
jgi:hypothetical protein